MINKREILSSIAKVWEVLRSFVGQKVEPLSRLGVVHPVSLVVTLLAMIRTDSRALHLPWLNHFESPTAMWKSGGILDEMIRGHVLIALSSFRSHMGHSGHGLLLKNHFFTFRVERKNSWIKELQALVNLLLLPRSYLFDCRFTT